MDEGGFHLNDQGRDEMRRLVESVRGLLNADSTLILTSTANRARESAELIAAFLKIKNVEEHEILLSDRSRPEDFPGVLKLIRTVKDGVDTLVLVTHLEYAKYFPSFFGEEELGAKLDYLLEIKKGQAWVIDCLQKNIFLIP
jgi:phosphohistidine phosphatase SixA